MDIKNGQILALASYPTYDPNAFERGLTVAEAENL
jgi:penicillin-binding protein 2